MTVAEANKTRSDSIVNIQKLESLQGVKDRNIIEILYDETMAIAMDYCNRTYPDELDIAIAYIVQDFTRRKYQRRGEDGANSASEGGQSVSYQDIDEALEKKLIYAHKRYLP